MATWPYSEIESKIRRVTGRLTEREMTSDEILKRTNRYYQLTFPAEVKLDAKLTRYRFQTEENQAFYDVPSTLYTNFVPPATINNLNMLWYQDPKYFFENNPQQYTFSTPWTGDGTTTAFSTSVTGFPIFPSALTISDGIETFEDTNENWTTSNVNLVGDQGGSSVINYNTGSVAVTFNTAPANGVLIHLNYIVFQPGRPQNILLFNEQFRLFPTPDQVYLVDMQAYQVVSPFVNATDTPDLDQWGECIVYGTSKQIFADYGETESYAEAKALHDEQLSFVITRTEQNLLNIRADPNF